MQRRIRAARVMVIAMGSLALLAAGGDQGQGRHAKELSAEAQFSDDAGGGTFSAFQSDSSTTLVFAIWGDDPRSQVCTRYIDEFGNFVTVCTYTRSLYDYGWCAIPSGDLQLDTTSAQLTTTTGPDCAITRCTTDHSGPTPVTTCGPRPAATFDVTWTANDLYTTASEERSQDFGPFTVKSKGAFQGRSAFANGTALGRSLTDAPGILGESRKASTVQVLPAP